VVLPEIPLEGHCSGAQPGVTFMPTTVNLAFILGYRPHTNVVSEPTVVSKLGFSCWSSRAV